MGAGRDGSSERSLSEGLLYYISILLEYRRLILATTAAVMAATLLFCALSLILPAEKSPLPNIYAAQASILIQQTGQADLAGSILGGLGFDQRASQSSAFDNGDLVLEILRSRVLLDRLIEEFDMVSRYRVTVNIKGKSRALVLKKTVFDYSRNTGSLKITFEDIDPVFSCRVVNRMVGLLDEWFNQNRGMAKQKQRKMLEEKIEEVKNDISALQERLKELQRKYGVLNVQDLGTSQAASLANLRAQLILKEIDIKNYSSFSKIDDPRLEQLKTERQNLLDLIGQNQTSMLDSSQARGGQKSLPDIAQEFTQLTLQLDIQQRIYNTLSPQYEAAKLTPESEPVFQVLEMAEVPDTKSRPERARIVFLASLIGLASGIVIAIAANAVERIKRDPEKMRYFSLERRKGASS